MQMSGDRKDEGRIVVKNIIEMKRREGHFFESGSSIPVLQPTAKLP